VFTCFNCELITTQDISITGVPQIEKFANRLRETSKLGGTRLILLFLFGAFTCFNCELVTTQDISIVVVHQIEKTARGVWESSKLGGT
jgi:hypothetical protein